MKQEKALVSNQMNKCPLTCHFYKCPSDIEVVFLISFSIQTHCHYMWFQSHQKKKIDSQFPQKFYSNL